MDKLMQACELSMRDWLSAFPTEIPKAEYSKNHEKWKKKLFDKMRNDRYHRITTRTVKIMLVAAVISAMLLTAFVKPSSRELVLDIFEDAGQIILSEHNDNLIGSDLEIGYVPEGFTLESKDGNKLLQHCKYISNNGSFFHVEKTVSKSSVYFDTEGTGPQKFIEDNIEYVFNESESGSGILIWTKNDYIYSINGYISLDEMKKIAKHTS